MTLDINKIIQESVQNTIDQSKPEVETLEENDTSTSQDTKVVEEGTSVSTSVQESYDPAMASAISAGLGAMNFRNHVRTLQEEGKLKKAAKTAGALGAGSAAALGGLAAAGQGDLHAGADEVEDMAKSAAGKAKKGLQKGLEKTQDAIKGATDKGADTDKTPKSTKSIADKMRMFGKSGIAY